MATVDMFMKITGARSGWIKGESAHSKHADWIEVLSFSWGGTAPRDAATGQATGRRQYRELRFTDATQRSTPVLLNAFASNENLNEVVLAAVRAGGTQSEYLTIKLMDAQISSFDLAGAGENPSEEFGLVFQSIELSYRPQNPDGTTGAPIVFEDDWSSPTA
jgi:type VI secretion system secreted protein Hcp